MSIKDMKNSEYFINHYNSLQRSKNNGRIDILSNNFNNSVFKLYDRIPIESHTTEYREALTEHSNQIYYRHCIFQKKI